MQYHDVANIFPLMSDVELQDLAADIATNGLHNAIWTYQGKIIDGRNRYQACKIANIEPRYQEWKGGTYAELVAFVVSMNIKRRHLNASQLGVLSLSVEAELAKDAKERQAAQAIINSPFASNKEIFPYSSETEKGQARDQAAAITGANPRYIQDAKKIKREAPDLIPEIQSGAMTIPQAKREMVKRERIESPPLPQSSDKYRVIYADPPWSYGNSGIINDDNYGHVGRHYTSMTIQELCALPVKDLAEKDAVLFMWVTSPLLAECFQVISAWGFQYKTSFVWDKIKHNFGHYNSVRHELLLVCTRGSCTPDNPKLYDSVQSIERTDTHSEKPEEFRAIIDDLYTHGRKIELFARRAVDGWDTWGNEL